MSPAATAAAVPPLEPPVWWSSRYGLETGPVCALLDVTPVESSWSASLPVIVAPASRSVPTTAASTGGVQPSSPGVPAPVGMSAVPMESLIPIGSPCSGPRDASGRRAAARTASPSNVTYAPRCESRSVRRTSASTYSSRPSSPEPSIATASVAPSAAASASPIAMRQDPMRVLATPCSENYSCASGCLSGASMGCFARRSRPRFQAIWEPRATPPATPRSATTPSSPTAARRHSSRPTGRSTGSAGRASTARRSSPRCWTRSAAAPGASGRSATSPSSAATCRRPTSSRRRSPRRRAPSA